jgi:hypothetical protein
MEIHIVKYEYKDHPKQNTANNIIGQSGEMNRAYFIAPPIYEGKMTIDKDFNLTCASCNDNTIITLTNATKKLVDNGFENRLNVIKSNNGYSYEIVKKEDPVFLEILKNMLLTTIIKDNNKGTYFFLREIDADTGNKYLNHGWRKENKKNELLDATLLLGGENIAEKNWKTLWRPKVIRSKPVTEKQKQWQDTFVTL